MKKILLFSVAILLIFSAKAQMDITIGPKVGFNVTNITNFDMKNKLSVHLGGFAEFRFTDFLAIQPELLYSRQGTRDKIDGDKYKLRVNYLNIPMLAKLYVLNDLSIDLGPELGFALNAKSKRKSGDTTVKTKIKENNTVVLNFAVGISYNWDNLMLSARYNIGLSNVMDKDKCDGNNKNHVFQLSAGYRLANLF
ncbi:MAG: porin family protein [Odoribacter sp.]